MTKIKITVLLLLLITGKNYAQTLADTTAMINEFSRVMSFATQPCLYFTTITKTNAAPVLQEQDTMSVKGIFFKNKSDIYYNTGGEEVYLQDSLMIQVNQKRKSIWISKVDVASKEKMTVLPVSNSQLQELFSKKYTFKKTKLSNVLSVLHFETKQKAPGSAVITTMIRVEYLAKDFLPVAMAVIMHMQQPLTDELRTELKNENIEENKLIQNIEGIKYLVRMQNISVVFDDITDAKEKVMNMPSWKDILTYKEAEQEFIATGLYKDYEVTKTF